MPVDGFWSISVYNAKGYFEPNPQNAYTLNNITAKPGADGSIAIQFGGCDGKVDELPADAAGLELPRAALSPAGGNPRQVMDLSGAPGGDVNATRRTIIARTCLRAYLGKPIGYAAPRSGAASDDADLKTARQKVDRMDERLIRPVDGETRTALPLSSPGRALSAANLTEAVDEIKLWATEQGLRGATARDLFEGYCRRLEAHGFELMRAYVSTQTLHPQWTGYGYSWKREWQSVREQQFARGGPVSQEWLASPFYALIRRSQGGEKKVWLRRRLELGPDERDFPALVDFYNAGATDYLCLGFRFGENADPSQGLVFSIPSRPIVPAASMTRKSNSCTRPCRNCRSR